MGKHQGLNRACEHSEVLSVFFMVWAVCFFYHCKMPQKILAFLFVLLQDDFMLHIPFLLYINL